MISTIDQLSFVDPQINFLFLEFKINFLLLFKKDANSNFKFNLKLRVASSYIEGDILIKYYFEIMIQFNPNNLYYNQNIEVLKKFF